MTDASIAAYRQPSLTAKEAGLRYVHEGGRGLRRVRRGRGFRYLDCDGKTPCEDATRDWIEALAIPPAWQEVWICPQRNGHILATGIDEAGRKQYLYHPKWSEQRNLAKFAGLRAFAHALPAIRRAVRRDIKRDRLTQRAVVAAALRLIDRQLIRVGSRAYAKQNNSFGATTLRPEHIDVNGSVLHLEFRGKGGAERELDVRDPQLTKIVRDLQELPGQSLFQYVDDDGHTHVIDSQDVNHYLHEVSGEQLTAKDFRTWGGTVAAADFLYRREGELEDSLPLAVDDPRVKKLEVAAVRHAAQLLGNTLATCRSYYVHPQLQEAFARGEIAAAFRRARTRTRPRGLRIAERAVLHLLERWNGS